MKLSLTRAQMLERRRISGGLEPLRSDCSIEYTDGIDIDRLLEQQLRARYVWMLDHADPSMLAVESVGGIKESAAPHGGSKLRLPPSCRRALDVELDGWEVPAHILPSDMFGTILSLQANTFRAAKARHPVAVTSPGGDIYAWPGGQLRQLNGISDPGDDSYILDESGLSYLLDYGKGNTQTGL